MNETDTITRMLENVGLHVRGIDANFIYIEDPACIIRGFENFLDYAWMVLGLFTGGLVIGWGISMIRGAKNDIKENFKTLVLIFGILTAVWPLLNLIYGGDLLGMGCKTTRISISGVNEILAAKLQARGTDTMLYEDIDIYDSGSGIRPIYEMPDSEENQDLSYLMNWDPSEVDENFSGTHTINRTTTDDSNYANGRGGFNRRTNSTNRTSNESNDNGGGTGGNSQNASGNSTNISPISSDNRTAVSAVNLAPGEITYTAADGSKYTHVGGSLTWRANNPGALRHSNFTKRMGAIGATSNGFAIFPNAEVGRNAGIALLKTEKYQNKTLAEAIHIYAPSSDGNNPTSYAARLARSMGISVNTYLRDMSETQIQRMAEGIRSIEGWRAGNIRSN